MKRCSRCRKKHPRHRFGRNQESDRAEWPEETLGIVIPEWGYPRNDCRPYAACR